MDGGERALCDGHGELIVRRSCAHRQGLVVKGSRVPSVSTARAVWLYKPEIEAQVG